MTAQRVPHPYVSAHLLATLTVRAIIAYYAIFGDLTLICSIIERSVRQDNMRYSISRCARLVSGGTAAARLGGTTAARLGGTVAVRLGATTGYG